MYGNIKILEFIMTFWNELQRFIIFGLIGALNSVLDVLLWKFFVNYFSKKPKILSLVKKIRLNVHTLAHTLSFGITVVSSYFLNKNITWNDSSNKGDYFQGVRFFAVAIFSWIVTTFILNYLINNKKVIKIVDTIALFEQTFTRKESLIKKHYPTLAKIITIVISMVTNFIGYKILVFK